MPAIIPKWATHVSEPKLKYRARGENTKTDHDEYIVIAEVISAPHSIRVPKHAALSNAAPLGE